ncbi:MAG TPA: S41 family peptidase, partial [Terriglobia bacterium]
NTAMAASAHKPAQPAQPSISWLRLMVPVAVLAASLLRAGGYASLAAKPPGRSGSPQQVSTPAGGSQQSAAAPSGAANIASDDPVASLAAQVARVYAAVEGNYLEPVDPDRALLDGAIRQALARLDPFSSFFDRDQFRQLQEQQRGQTLGFGSILYLQPGKVLVISAAQGSPSSRAGIAPGDEIVAVNGTRIAGLDLQSLISVLQGARSGPVRLSVLHPGRVVSEDMNLKPAEVALPTVDKAFRLKPDIGYVHLTSFESKTPDELSQALERLERAEPAPAPNPAVAQEKTSRPGSQAGSTPQLRGLILDLRNNHGGLVDSALGVASLFLPPGLSVLTIRGRVQPPQTATTAEPPKSYHTYRGPLVVLVNGETASAAEVAAAALEEHDRAVIAGEPTYGKGVVQNVIPLSDATGLALTTAQYFTPSGRSIQRPIPGTALEAMATSRTGESSGFRTDDGRELAAGGGVTPDVILPGRSLDPWVQFLEQRGAFTDFALDYRSVHEQVPLSFQPDDQTLGDFQDFLHRGGVRTPEEYWDRDRDYLKLRIRVELMNVVYGLQVGDEADTEGDPQVQGAATLFGRLNELLKPAKEPSP